MKTSLKILTTVSIVIINLNVNAQRSHNGNQNQSQNQSQGSQNNHQQNDRRMLASNHHPGGNKNGSKIVVHIGGHPNYYNSYNHGYNNYYNVKKAARNSIHQSAATIGQALQFSDWNDIYSPWLAKAIRHQQYARQLYFWGDYAGAMNHSERAGFLAWNTLNYFNNPYGYNNNSYPDPYSDPNNPYYRQSNPNSSSQPNSNEDFGYRKSSTDKTTEESNSAKRESQPNIEQKLEKTELDNILPSSKMDDRELLKTNSKDLDIE